MLETQRARATLVSSTILIFFVFAVGLTGYVIGFETPSDLTYYGWTGALLMVGAVFGILLVVLPMSAIIMLLVFWVMKGRPNGETSPES